MFVALTRVGKASDNLYYMAYGDQPTTLTIPNNSIGIGSKTPAFMAPTNNVYSGGTMYNSNSSPLNQTVGAPYNYSTPINNTAGAYVYSSAHYIGPTTPGTRPITKDALYTYSKGGANYVWKQNNNETKVISNNFGNLSVDSDSLYTNAIYPDPLTNLATAGVIYAGITPGFIADDTYNNKTTPVGLFNGADGGPKSSTGYEGSTWVIYNIYDVINAVLMGNTPISIVNSPTTIPSSGITVDQANQAFDKMFKTAITVSPSDNFKTNASTYKGVFY
jgi:hypothetical protein